MWENEIIRREMWVEADNFKVCKYGIPGPMSPRDSSPLEDI